MPAPRGLARPAPAVAAACATLLALGGCRLAEIRRDIEVLRAPPETQAEGPRVEHEPPDRGRVDPPLAAAALPVSREQRHVGEVARLDDPRFSPETGRTGLWEPLRFLGAYGIGVWFLQPHDPAKVPVLFVHGSGGYPQEWSYLVSRLDRRRFEPWVFQYPSGLRLDTVSAELAGDIEELRSRLRIPALVVVAHSMGGLVSRAAMARCCTGAGTNVIRLFVSISTPWGGHGAARLGVDRSPLVVPSWHDMAPGSRFLASLFASPLPPGTAYHLFFGFRGGNLLIRDNNDGTVTLESMLAKAAQRDAVRIHGFDETHQSILRSDGVADALGELLAQAAR